jgi:predicted DNA-binding protein with PD1-like motif
MDETLLEFVSQNPMASTARRPKQGVALMEGRVGKIFFARLREDEDLAESIKRNAEESRVKAGIFMLIGALKCAVLGCYREGEYITTKLEGPLEVASCTGNIAVDEKGQTAIHAHMVVSNEKCQAFGGHLMKGCHVGPTAELVIIEAAGIDLRRRYDEKTKLKLLKLR